MLATIKKVHKNLKAHLNIDYHCQLSEMSKSKKGFVK